MVNNKERLGPPDRSKLLDYQVQKSAASKESKPTRSPGLRCQLGRIQKGYRQSGSGAIMQTNLDSEFGC